MKIAASEHQPAVKVFVDGVRLAEGDGIRHHLGHGPGEGVGETERVDVGGAVRRLALVDLEPAAVATVEALAEDIAKLILEEANVIKVRVRVEKPGAVDI